MKILLTPLFVILFSGLGYSQVPVSGNPTCSSLGYNQSYKIDPPKLGNNIYQVNGGTVATTLDTMDTVSFLASSNFVGACIIKGGNKANIYYFSPPTNSGTNLTAPVLDNGNLPDISHIDFCYSTTASTVVVEGKVVTNSGRPISKVLVSAYNTTTGEVKTGLTNPFGYYTIEGLEVGNFYVIQARAKGYSFEFKGYNLTESLTDYDFIAH